MSNEYTRHPSDRSCNAEPNKGSDVQPQQDAENQSSPAKSSTDEGISSSDEEDKREDSISEASKVFGPEFDIEQVEGKEEKVAGEIVKPWDIIPSLKDIMKAAVELFAKILPSRGGDKNLEYVSVLSSKGLCM